MAKFKARIVSKAVSQRAQKFINSSFKDIEKEITKEINKQIDLALTADNSREINSMVKSRARSELKAQLGLTAPQRKINGIKRFLKNQVQVFRSQFGTRRAKIVVGLQPAYDIMVEEGFAFQDNQGRQGPARLPWLGWMINSGDSIIPGWTTGRGSNVISRSRTRTIMIPNRSTNWRVPSWASGTPTNNFISRALDKQANDYKQAVENILASALQRARRRF